MAAPTRVRLLCGTMVPLINPPSTNNNCLPYALCASLGVECTPALATLMRVVMAASTVAKGGRGSGDAAVNGEVVNEAYRIVQGPAFISGELSFAAAAAILPTDFSLAMCSELGRAALRVDPLSVCLEDRRAKAEADRAAGILPTTRWLVAPEEGSNLAHVVNNASFTHFLGARVPGAPAVEAAALTELYMRRTFNFMSSALSKPKDSPEHQRMARLHNTLLTAPPTGPFNFASILDYLASRAPRGSLLAAGGWEAPRPKRRHEHAGLPSAHDMLRHEPRPRRTLDAYMSPRASTSVPPPMAVEETHGAVLAAASGAVSGAPSTPSASPSPPVALASTVSRPVVLNKHRSLFEAWLVCVRNP